MRKLVGIFLIVCMIVNNCHHAYNDMIWVSWNQRKVDIDVVGDCDQGIFFRMVNLSFGDAMLYTTI